MNGDGPIATGNEHRVMRVEHRDDGNAVGSQSHRAFEKHELIDVVGRAQHHFGWCIAALPYPR
jgi:hypothetical protein